MIIELNSKDNALEVYRSLGNGVWPEGLKVVETKSTGLTFLEYTFPEITPPFFADITRPVVVEIGGRRWEVSLEFQYRPGQDVVPEGCSARFEETDRPILIEDHSAACGRQMSRWFGQPSFIQSTYVPHLNGRAAMCLAVNESGWGDCGNENVLVALDDEGLPAGIFHEFSCC